MELLSLIFFSTLYILFVNLMVYVLIKQFLFDNKEFDEDMEENENIKD